MSSDWVSVALAFDEPFDICGSHYFAKVIPQDSAAEAVEDGAQIVASAAGVDVAILRYANVHAAT